MPHRRSVTRHPLLGSSALAAAAAICISACSVSEPWVRPDWAPVEQPPDPTQVDTRLLLVGDAGRARAGDPVLAALGREAAALPHRTWVVFLGDNIYPEGLPPAQASEFAASELRLRAQIDAVVPTGAQVIFLPGNHDYALDGWQGWERQRAYVESLARSNLQVRPAAGCPGPDVIDAGSRLRLVLLDTQWWFQDGAKPQHPQSHCACDREDEIVAGLDSAIASAGARHVVVAAHHPLATHGHHGGHYDWQDHVFPLRAAAKWAWVPLPGLGSLYPLARKLGITEQDLTHGRYREMRAAFQSAFRRRPPLLYAAGHEHTLQLLERSGARLHVVSGSGTLDRPDDVGRGDDTLFACGCSGYARVDLLNDGRVWLQFVTMDADGRASSPFGRWITMP
jgi:hypothetical protein